MISNYHKLNKLLSASYTHYMHHTWNEGRVKKVGMWWYLTCNTLFININIPGIEDDVGGTGPGTGGTDPGPTLGDFCGGFALRSLTIVPWRLL